MTSSSSIHRARRLADACLPGDFSNRRPILRLIDDERLLRVRELRWYHAFRSPASQGLGAENYSQNRAVLIITFSDVVNGGNVEGNGGVGGGGPLPSIPKPIGCTLQAPNTLGFWQHSHAARSIALTRARGGSSRSLRAAHPKLYGAAEKTVRRLAGFAAFER